MTDRFPAGAAHQRIGTALSRQLLSALRFSMLNTGTRCAPLAAAPGVGETHRQLQPPTNTAADLPAPADTRKSDQGAVEPFPEPGEFRVYFPFGHNVQAVPSLRNVEDGNFRMATEDEDKPEVTGTGDGTAELPELLGDPPRRRSWLLAKALETHPLDQALDLARVAEAFITGSPAVETSSEAATSALGRSSDRAPEAGPNQAPGPKVPRPRLGLAPEVRDRLLERLAQGARNAELASEFNLSPKQVQGIRIGSAREISRRRNSPTDQG
jgi:hypothetical protein